MIKAKRLRGDNVAFLEGDKLVARSCFACNEIKDAEMFSNNKKGYKGKVGKCKQCRKKEYESDKPQEKERAKRYWRENADKITAKHREWVENNPRYYTEHRRRYYVDNREQVIIWAQNRRAMKESLPNDFTVEEAELLLNVFEGCALTGDEDYHFDHAIPLATGCGGTTIGNMVPLRGDLNSSKNARNLFEWFRKVKERESLSQERFNKMVQHLAEVNGMTVFEYTAYVYECHKGG